MRIYVKVLLAVMSVTTIIFAETTPETEATPAIYHRVTVSEMALSFNLPQTWPKQFYIMNGSPQSITIDSPFTLNMRRNDSSAEPGTFSVISVSMFKMASTTRFGYLFQNGKPIGISLYGDYLKKADRKNIEFHAADDSDQALLFGQYMLSRNKAPADKILHNIHIPNSIGFVGERRLGGVPYTTYEIYVANKDRMTTIIIAVPASRFSELQAEMDEISKQISYEQ